jgi:hypothetical protein
MDIIAEIHPIAGLYLIEQKMVTVGAVGSLPSTQTLSQVPEIRYIPRRHGMSAMECKAPSPP